MPREWAQLDEPWEAEGFEQGWGVDRLVFSGHCLALAWRTDRRTSRSQRGGSCGGSGMTCRASHGAGADSSSASATWLPCRVGQLPSCLWRSPLMTRGKYFLMWFLEGISVHKGLYKRGPHAYLSCNMIHIERRRTSAKLEKSLRGPT